jgi:cytochrome c556
MVQNGAIARPSQETFHMIRVALTLATVSLGLSVAFAAQDPIAARRALMKANGDQAKIGAAMIKGEMPFDPAAAHKIFTTFEDTSAKAPALFPETSKTGGETAASLKIWQNLDDFKTKLVKLGSDAKEADAKVTDLASFKAGFISVTKDCRDCHEGYRIKRS